MNYNLTKYDRGKNSWDDFFFDMCQVVSAKSKDPSTKVGAVIVNSGNSIISTGFNGFPIGIDDHVESRYERPEKYLWTCHAEENAIAFAARNGALVEQHVHTVNGISHLSSFVDFFSSSV